ncbi:unnamed protein product [Closterium sp. NIES-64]|nr:unnamed protein product [Closterium sp. NIES-64]
MSAAIPLPPSSSFPATSVFLPALLRLGADLSDDPDDREQVVAQGFANAHARPQGRRHRRTGSLDAMLLAETAAAGKCVSFVTASSSAAIAGSTACTTAAALEARQRWRAVGEDVNPLIGCTPATAGSTAGATAANSAARNAACSTGGFTDEDAPKNVSSPGEGSSSSSTSSCDGSKGFQGFQPVPTTFQPASSLNFAGFKPALLRLGDDLDDDPDDWEWLAGGQQLTWSNPGGPMKREASGNDGRSVDPAGPFGHLAPIAATTAAAAAAAAPMAALPPRSPKSVAAPVARTSYCSSQGNAGSSNSQQQGQGQGRQQHRRTHSFHASLQHGPVPARDDEGTAPAQGPPSSSALSEGFEGFKAFETFERLGEFDTLESNKSKSPPGLSHKPSHQLSPSLSHQLLPGLSAELPLRIPAARLPSSSPSAKSWSGGFFSGMFGQGRVEQGRVEQGRGHVKRQGLENEPVNGPEKGHLFAAGVPLDSSAAGVDLGLRGVSNYRHEGSQWHGQWGQGKRGALSTAKVMGVMVPRLDSMKAH